MISFQSKWVDSIERNFGFASTRDFVDEDDNYLLDARTKICFYQLLLIMNQRDDMLYKINFCNDYAQFDLLLSMWNKKWFVHNHQSRQK